MLIVNGAVTESLKHLLRNNDAHCYCGVFSRANARIQLTSFEEIAIWWKQTCGAYFKFQIHKSIFCILIDQTRINQPTKKWLRSIRNKWGDVPLNLIITYKRRGQPVETNGRRKHVRIDKGKLINQKWLCFDFWTLRFITPKLASSWIRGWNSLMAQSRSAIEILCSTFSWLNFRPYNFSFFRCNFRGDRISIENFIQHYAALSAFNFNFRRTECSGMKIDFGRNVYMSLITFFFFLSKKIFQVKSKQCSFFHSFGGDVKNLKSVTDLIIGQID